MDDGVVAVQEVVDGGAERVQFFEVGRSRMGTRRNERHVECDDGGVSDMSLLFILHQS